MLYAKVENGRLITRNFHDKNVQIPWKRYYLEKEPDAIPGWHFENGFVEKKDYIQQVWMKVEDDPVPPTFEERVMSIVDYNIMMGNMEDPEEALNNV